MVAVKDNIDIHGYISLSLAAAFLVFYAPTLSGPLTLGLGGVIGGLMALGCKAIVNDALNKKDLSVNIATNSFMMAVFYFLAATVKGVI